LVWDLRGALLKKQENESARLADFEFRLRARTMRLLAEALGLEAEPLVKATVLESDDSILARTPGAADHYLRCLAEARRQLIEEHGDPAPHRLA